uniref:Thioredoxin like 4A n=1 Tax=Lynx canadensis TaxID=61383 RepID=A0A667H753_LYNCA
RARLGPTAGLVKTGSSRPRRLPGKTPLARPPRRPPTRPRTASAQTPAPRLRTSRPAAPDARRTSAGTRTLTSARTHCPARVHARKDRSAGLSRCQRCVRLEREWTGVRGGRGWGTEVGGDPLGTPLPGSGPPGVPSVQAPFRGSRAGPCALPAAGPRGEGGGDAWPPCRQCGLAGRRGCVEFLSRRYPSGPEDVVHAPALAQRLAGGPGHPFGGRPGGRHPVWTRLGPHLHEDGRGPVQYSRKEMADSGGSSSSCYEPCLDTPAVLKNKHIMIDLGTGNNNKINWAMEDKQEMIDIIETVYRGARKGRGLVVSPKDYSTKYRY